MNRIQNDKPAIGVRSRWALLTLRHHGVFRAFSTTKKSKFLYNPFWKAWSRRISPSDFHLGNYNGNKEKIVDLGRLYYPCRSISLSGLWNLICLRLDKSAQNFTDPPIPKQDSSWLKPMLREYCRWNSSELKIYCKPLLKAFSVNDVVKWQVFGSTFRCKIIHRN